MKFQKMTKILILITISFGFLFSASHGKQEVGELSPQYQYEWGEPPKQTWTRESFSRWLELMPKPGLKMPDNKIKKEVLTYFKIRNDSKVLVAIVGPPRITGLANPKFYIWLQVKNRNGKIMRDGAGRLSLTEEGMRVSLLDFAGKEELRKSSTLLTSIFPYDAVILIKKFLK